MPSFEKIPGDKGEAEKVPCGNCKGDGVVKVNGKEKKCSTCNGKGKIKKGTG